MNESGRDRRGRRAADAQPGEAAREPRDGQDEEREASGARAPEAGVEREREDRDEVLGREEEMPDPVVHGPEARRHEVRIRAYRDQESEERECSRARYTRPHRIAFQRNPSPAIVTSVPATRSAMRPHVQRWTRPIPMPVRWRRPVATTKPML